VSEWLYVPGSGLFHRLDPRPKMVFAASSAVYLALESEPSVLLVALGVLQALALSCRATRSRVLPLWKALSPLLLILLVFGSLRWHPEDALLAIGPLGITASSVWHPIGMAARIVSISLAISLVLWTTELGDAVAGLKRLGIPFTVGFPVVMVLQHVVTFHRQFQRILEAQQSRGLTFSRWNPYQVARAYIPVLVPLLITALRSVDTLALSLQSRGFEPGKPRTSRRVLRLRPMDWAFMAVCAGAIAALAWV
jgi:energy-coupling factor transporter transmembrane protein EcfT